MNEVVNAMGSKEVNPGDIVIQQGDPGDCFYIIDTGRYEVRVIGEGTSRRSQEAGGDLVYTYEGGPDSHPGFGELSLMCVSSSTCTTVLTSGVLGTASRERHRSWL
jgi:cAMP-dependent protein kinase regulator